MCAGTGVRDDVNVDSAATARSGTPVLSSGVPVFYALEASSPSINISLEIQRGLARLGVVVFRALVNPPVHHARWDGNEKDGHDGDDDERRHGGSPRALQRLKL